MNTEHATRLALPGKGTLEAATLAFLAECGMKVSRNNPRQYLARISGMPDVEVVFQWIDVSSCADLWHLAGYYQAHKGRVLRIATKYPALTGQFLRQHGITHCKIISPHGALEAAPLTDTADLIVDLTETGTTLRENHLKLLEDGVVLRSQACLIGNSGLLRQNEQALYAATTMLELIEARMQARNRSILTALIPSENVDSVQHMCSRLQAFVADSQLQISAPGHETLGLYTLSGVVNVRGSAAELLEIVTALRSAGASYINITPLTYRFAEEAVSVRNLRKRLKRTT